MVPPKYHVYLEYEHDRAKSLMRFNFSEEELVRTFVSPLKAGKAFFLCGKLLIPAKVVKVVIFWSYEEGGALVLPNREMVAGHPDKKFVIEKISLGKVKGVAVCTEKFLPANRVFTV